MLNGVSEQDEVLLHDARCGVVLCHHIVHVFLEHCQVINVLIHVIDVDVVAEDGRHFVGTDVVEGLVEDGAEFFGDDLNEGFLVFVVDESVVKDAVRLVNPQTRHRHFRVVKVLVCAHQPLEDLQAATQLRGEEGVAFERTGFNVVVRHSLARCRAG